MKRLLTSVGFLLVPAAAYATPVFVPSPEMDMGLAGMVMVAGAAFLTLRRRRRA
jgi:LPXTG-motif cell wall-anchored protein